MSRPAGEGGSRPVQKKAPDTTSSPYLGDGAVGVDALVLLGVADVDTGGLELGLERGHELQGQGHGAGISNHPCEQIQAERRLPSAPSCGEGSQGRPEARRRRTMGNSGQQRRVELGQAPFPLEPRVPWRLGGRGGCTCPSPCRRSPAAGPAPRAPSRTAGQREMRWVNLGCHRQTLGQRSCRIHLSLTFLRRGQSLQACDGE